MCQEGEAKPSLCVTMCVIFAIYKKKDSTSTLLDNGLLELTIFSSHGRQGLFAGASDSYRERTSKMPSTYQVGTTDKHPFKPPRVGAPGKYITNIKRVLTVLLVH